MHPNTHTPNVSDYKAKRWSTLFFGVVICVITFMSRVSQVSAQEFSTPSVTVTATTSATPRPTVKKEKEDVTLPEKEEEKQGVLGMLQQRGVDHLTFINFAPYAVYYAVKAGVPANTIMLIMLLPILATLIVATRYIVGLNSMGILVPVALSITLLATGIIPGFIMLAAILLASVVARLLLKKIRIMQMPKMALSMLVVAVFLFIALTISAGNHLFDVKQLSFFPILLFILLSDRVVALFLERNLQETFEITTVTLILSMLGFMLLSWEWLRTTLLVYPELVLLLIPINILIGRYFGLRMTEYIKFQPVLRKK